MANSIDTSVLARDWHQEREEGGLRIFGPKPAGLSRPHYHVELRADGSMTESPLTPDDRAASRPGRWTVTPDNRLLLHSVDLTQKPTAWDIVEASPTRLVLRKPLPG
jgi:hypothetical protein